MLLGHTLDDQAETVLLGLTRGSGGRSLQGMRPSFGVFARPLLGVRRADTVTACLVEGLEPWDDPHNSDPGYTRVRVRDRVLPVLEAELGPGIAEALARTADQLREDTALLDDLADQALARARRDGGLDVETLRLEPPSIRHRVLHRAALDAGVPAVRADPRPRPRRRRAPRRVAGPEVDRPARPAPRPAPRRTAARSRHREGSSRHQRTAVALTCDRRRAELPARCPPSPPRLTPMDSSHVENDLVNILFTEEQIQQRLAEMALQITEDYEGRDLLVVGVLRGAVMVMADLARAMPRHLEMDWMAVSSYGSGTKSSGVVRILKDLDTDISGRDVLIVDEIIDTGLTLSWLVNNLSSRSPASVEIATLLRKPEALSMPVEPKYVGWDIPNEFVVGYGLDYRERYRNLRDIGTLAPHVYS